MLISSYLRYLKFFILFYLRAFFLKPHIANNFKFAQPTKKFDILIAITVGGMWPCSTFEMALGLALKLRGYKVAFMLCDGYLPACQLIENHNIDENLLLRHGVNRLACSGCFNKSFDIIKTLGIPCLFLSDLAASSDLKRARILSSSKLTLKSHALSGALRYFARGSLAKNLISRKIFKLYQNAAYRTYSSIDGLVKNYTFNVAVFSHGIYVPHGVIGQALRENNIRIVNWMPSYRKNTVLFSHDNSYHFTMVSESNKKWRSAPFSKAQEGILLKYLDSRKTGKNDWISFQPNKINKSSDLYKSLGLNKKKPIVTLLTNVMWDAQLHFKESAFINMLEWLRCTIDFYIKNQNFQLAIRIHPAEILGTVPTKQPISDEIKKLYSNLPNNIKIIKPEDPISTYDLSKISNAILVYGTKAAIEFACRGKHVIVSGEAWARNKKFTYDVSNKKEYYSLLSRLPFKKPLSKKKINLARKYAYYLFFKRMIPIKYLQSINHFGPYKVNVKNLSQLLPGQDVGLDIICSGIINGSEFVYE